MPRIKLTENVVSRLGFCSVQTYYYDTEMPGLAVATGKRTKTYILHKDIGGKSVKLTIGRVEHLSLEQARREVAEMSLQIIKGIDPRQERQRQEASEVEAKEIAITLGKLIDKYIEAKKLKPNTKKDLKTTRDYWLVSWSSESIHSITSKMIQERHQQLGRDNGETSANKAMRYLRAVLSYAQVYYNLPENPVKALSKSRTWFKSRRRENLIKPEQFRPWHQALMAEDDDRIRDLGMILLLTGLRLSEGLSLQWQYIFLQRNLPTFVAIDTKTEDSIEFPITRPLLVIFERRFNKNAGKSAWVFPGVGRTGHLTEPKKAIDRMEERCGFRINYHDLRRTFETVAESLDLPHYALKRILGHSLCNDITAGYIVRNVERLREPTERVVQRIMELLTPPDDTTGTFGDGI